MNYSKIKQTVLMVFATAIACTIISCENEFDLPEAGSIADLTPPEADFSFTQGQGSNEEWKEYTFANLSSSATTYAWNFGDGNTSTEVDAVNTYPGEGTYTVTLTASDALGVVSETSQVIEIIEPEEPLVPDPVLINADFDRLAKLGSSNTCSCSGWDNDDIGEQGESSSGNGGSDNVVKFDNAEPDHVYQEFAVTPNSDYTMQIVVAFQSSTGGTSPSMLELRVLTGAGYISGYTPTYYAAAPDFPNSGYGYTTVAQVETAANNILTETINSPGNTDYNTYTYTFNSGANDSVALFIRGMGGSTGGSYGYNSGDEEIRADSVTITANN